MTATADTTAGDHSRTAIFATSTAVASTAIMNIAADTGMDDALAACSTMASFASWCWR